MAAFLRRAAARASEFLGLSVRAVAASGAAPLSIAAPSATLPLLASRCALSAPRRRACRQGGAEREETDAAGFSVRREGVRLALCARASTFA